MSRQTVVKPCLLLLTGGLAAQHSTLLLPSDVLSLTLVASLLASMFRRTRSCACLLGGYVLFQMAGQEIIEGRLHPDYTGDSMLTIVRIVDFPKSDGHSVTMNVEPLGDHRIPARVRLSWYEAPIVPLIGEVWELEVRLRPPRGRLNPGGFDRESWLFRDKYHATGYVVAGKRNRLLWSGEVSGTDRFRARFIEGAIVQASSLENGAVLGAIGVGARHRMTRSQWDRYAATGTSHLMAISGLHVGLAAVVGFALAFGASLLIPTHGNRYLAAIALGVLVAVSYAFVTGFGVPARRAVIMLFLAAVTAVSRRQVSSTTVVATAALVVFVSDPIASMTPGFHLSFAAVVLLVWLARRSNNGGRGAVMALQRLVEMQVFLMFGLLPLTALIFNRFAVMATPVNLVAVPVFSTITVPLTLLGLACFSWWQWLADTALYFASLSVAAVDSVIRLAARPAFAQNLLADFSGLSFGLLVLPMAWVVLPRGWPGRHVALVGVVAVMAWKPGPPPTTCFDTWTLDVGQGLAVVIRSGEDVTLYDTGMAWRSGATAAEQVILPFLRSQGIGRIGRIVISHADLDHSGGLQSLLDHLEVDHVIVGEPLSGTHGWLCAAGQQWWSGPIRFEMLHPGTTQRGEGNNASCVLRVSAGPYVLLVTGDVEVAAERELLARNERLGADIVIVPHHGSLTSSSTPFVDAVRPQVAVVSAAWANRWGFPRPEVVSRWGGGGAEVLNTGRVGAVFSRICADKGLVAVTAERERRRRFWHAVD